MIKYKIQSGQFENVWLEAEDKGGDFIELTITEPLNETKIIVETVELEAMLGIIAGKKPTFWQKVIAYASMRTLVKRPEKEWQNPVIRQKVKIPSGEQN